MNRWTDLLVSFGIAVLLHGVLVLGAVWFWTLRPPELHPVFQGGDVSLAVTFVAAKGDEPAETHVEQQIHPVLREETGFKKQTPDIVNREPVAAGNTLTAPDTEPSDETPVSVRPQPVKRMDKAAAQLPEKEKDLAKLGAKTAAPVLAHASANVPANGSQNADKNSQSADATSDALRQGVNGAVRMQSEIRPYYPLGARLRGEEGVVMVRVRVNSLGRALRCEVARSSGYPLLDEAAVDAARRARYVFTRPEALRAEAETTLTFKFQLKE